MPARDKSHRARVARINREYRKQVRNCCQLCSVNSAVQGSGVFVREAELTRRARLRGRDTLYILTCAHLMSEACPSADERYCFTYYDWKTGVCMCGYARVLAYQKHLDIMLLRIEPGYEPRHCPPGVILAPPHLIRTSDPVYIIGNTAGKDEFSYVEGTIREAYFAHPLKVRAQIPGATHTAYESRPPGFAYSSDDGPGNSGGGVFHKRTGFLLGTVSYGIGSPTSDASFRYGVATHPLTNWFSVRRMFRESTQCANGNVPWPMRIPWMNTLGTYATCAFVSELQRQYPNVVPDGKTHVQGFVYVGLVDSSHVTAFKCEPLTRIVKVRRGKGKTYMIGAGEPVHGRQVIPLEFLCGIYDVGDVVVAECLEFDRQAGQFNNAKALLVTSAPLPQMPTVHDRFGPYVITASTHHT